MPGDPTTRRPGRAENIAAMERAFAAAAATPMRTWDRNKRGHKSGLVFMRPQGGRFSQSPANDVAAWFKSKLNAPPRSTVTIYDAAGKAVATYDPETRTRTPIPEAK